MHSSHGIRKLVIKVLIHITKSMHGVMLEIVGIHVVIVQEHAAIHILRSEIEPHVVPVSRPDLMVGRGFVSEIFRDGQG